MKRDHRREAQIIDAGEWLESGQCEEEIGRDLGVSEHTIYAWKVKYGGLPVNEAQRLKELEDENQQLKKLVANLSLDRDMLRSFIRKTGGARRDEGDVSTCWKASFRRPNGTPAS